MKLFLLSFLLFLVTISNSKANFPSDDDGVVWIEINPDNGATWEQFSNTYYMEFIKSSALGFKFTENVNYQVDSALSASAVYQEIAFATNPGVSVQFNLNFNGSSFFFVCEYCSLSMVGDFTVNGNGKYNYPSKFSNSMKYPVMQDTYIFFIYTGTLYMEGVTIENCFFKTGTIFTELCVVTLDSVTFSNNIGLISSALYSLGGSISLNNVKIEGSSVSDIASGVGQMNFAGGASVSGLSAVNMNNNDGSGYVCNTGQCIQQQPAPIAASGLSKGAKAAAITVPILVVFFCIGGYFFWATQKKKTNAKFKQPLASQMVVNHNL